MRAFTSSHAVLPVALLLALMARAGMAQPTAVAPSSEHPPATVVIAATRPYQEAEYKATVARLRKLLANQPASAGTESTCLTPRHMSTSMALDNLAADMRMRCGRMHIWARDTTLRRGLDAFERQDYAAAFGSFQDAWEKMGFKDAGLMLAKMHLYGLGTPKNPAAAVQWLEEVADGRDGVRDWLRLDPAASAGLTAPIEAAVMLARIHARGAGVPRDPEQALAWYGRAAASGVVLSLEADAMVPGLVPPAAVPAAAAADPVATAAGIPAASAAADPAAAAAGIPLASAAAPGAALVPPDAGSAGAAPASALAVPAAGRSTSSLEIDPAFTAVRVTGLRATPWKSYRALRAAIAAFEANQSLAPDAVFSFAVLPPAGKTLPPNFKLRVRTRDGNETPIALENGELFQLPALRDAGADADLVSNVREGVLRIGLLVHTRGVPPEKERLGDVRLRNEINRAIADVDHPNDDPACLRKRPGRNGCKARPRDTVWHRPRAPAGGATIAEGGRREALEGDRDARWPSYKMPVYSGRWGNDAIIEFDYKALARPPSLSEVAIYNAND